MIFERLDLGRMAYGPCSALQRKLQDDVVAGRRPNALVFVEHDPVLTLGASLHAENLLLSPEEYADRGIEVVRTDRGGDVTYHGPGQLVIYPIFHLEIVNRDLHLWLRQLEETMLVALATFGLSGRRFPPHTGAWIGDRKVAAIGIKVRRWVSMHGIALNCENNLAPFGTIVPCGISDYGVTSLSKELGRRVGIEEAMGPVVRAFETVFTATSRVGAIPPIPEGPP